MAKSDELRIDQQQLVQAWQETLPTVMNGPDRSEVKADEADERSLRVTIHVAGHQMYEFDFKVTYVDSREVKVELVDVEKDNVSIDERNDIVQQLTQDYIRHLHECAQALHQLTHA
ncbi:hypothetical protein M6D81_30185 [Paenibacillus sp. J5C_2022]|uniref:hypothetical protein n=1 Tax=Paenibacillus sp. J5C2022 TaxID=2977129 RepID=UPI0021D38C62|nr:hypothetical protein [Paenibacillus sp. J5C2022]MCU6712978.1 hypothetical protein [Paenibacillus sp. J5C2022]